MMGKMIRVIMLAVTFQIICGFGSLASDITEEQKAENIKKYAPKVYFHHEEQYFPGAVEDWFKAVEMRYLIKDTRKYIADTIIYGGGLKYLAWTGTEVTADNIAHFTNEQTGTNSSNDGKFYLARVQDSAKYGDNDGEVNAPVYVRYYEGPIFDEIQYLFWYPHNGNMGPALIDGASHEGDWERIAVLVKKNNGNFTVDSVKFNAHGDEHEWFKASDVQFEGTHPVVYSGHDSHASYNLKSATQTGYDSSGTEWKIDRPRGTNILLPDDHISNKGQVWETWNNIEVLDNQPWLNFRGLWGARSLDYKDGPSGPGPQNGSILESYDHKIVFYARDNVIGNLRATWNIDGEATYKITEDPPSGRKKLPNDDVRSLKILKPRAGTLITLYDSPDGSKSDDYVEIFIKRDVEHYVKIDHLEKLLDNNDVLVMPHLYNGLSGKVSRMEVKVNTTVPTSVVVLYEGNNSTQDLVGTIDASINQNLNLQQNIIENDEARSLEILHAKANTKITLYDDPNGGTGDDYATIYVKRNADKIKIGSFETYIDNADVTLIPRRFNGLDGKVSHIKIEPNGQPFTNNTAFIFFEGDNRTQDQVGVINVNNNQTQSFKFGSIVENDEARSLVIKYGKAGSYYRLADDPNGGLHDDYTEIFVKKDFERVQIDTFSRYIDNEYIRVIPHHVNGINGKVSSLYTDTRGNVNLPRGSVEFYEGNNCTQDLLGTWNIAPRSVNLKHDRIENDEIRSMRLRNTESGTIIQVYDSPNASWNDDVCIVEVKKYVTSYNINTFERSYEDEYVKVSFHRKNGLDGKISHIWIR